MKTKLIAFCVSSVLIGTGIVFNMNQDVSVPTVENFTKDTSLSVSKHEAIVSEHENVDKDEKTGALSVVGTFDDAWHRDNGAGCGRAGADASGRAG